MTLANQCYDIQTTCFIKSGDFILTELECTVTVSDQSEESRQYVVEAIDFGRCEIDSWPLAKSGYREAGNCTIHRPKHNLALKGNFTGQDRALWAVLIRGLDMQHIAEEVERQREDHF